MKVRPDFLNELKAIDPRLDIVDNPNRPQLANILLAGENVCPIPRDEIKDDPDPNYFIMTPNDWKLLHKSRNEAIGQVRAILEKIKNPEEAEIFFSRE